jgi:HECT-domain (ubiquitin-transferase)
MIRFDVLIINLQDGFTSESTAIIHLWKILNEFNEDEKKMFLKFVTGRLVRKFIYIRILLCHDVVKPNSNFSSCDGAC